MDKMSIIIEAQYNNNIANTWIPMQSQIVDGYVKHGGKGLKMLCVNL